MIKKSSFSSAILTGLYNILICTMLVEYLIQSQLILHLGEGDNSNKGARISNGLST